MMRKNCWALLLTLMLIFSTLTVQAEPAVEPDLPRSDAALSLMEYLESDPELMTLMEESIRIAHEINPDPNTNPVDGVDVEFPGEPEGSGCKLQRGSSLP